MGCGKSKDSGAETYPPLADYYDEAKTLERIELIKKSHPGNRATKYFKREYYDTLDEKQKKHFLRIIKSGVENPDSSLGCYAMEPNDYKTFRPFWAELLKDYHGTEGPQVSNWDYGGETLDLKEVGITEDLSMRVRVGRNLSEFPLPGAMTKDDRLAMEEKLQAAFNTLKGMEEFGGGYNSLTPGHAEFRDAKQYQQLVDDHIMFKDMSNDKYLVSAGISNDWPYGRGCYVSEDRGFIIWVGEEDHLRIMAMAKGTVLNTVFDRLKSALDVLSGMDGLSFATDDIFGVVTSGPSNIGTGMRASVHIQLPNLTADGTETKAKAALKPLNLQVRGTGGEHTPIVNGTIDVSPYGRFGITEGEIIRKLYDGIKLVVQLDAKAAVEAAAPAAEEAAPAAEAAAPAAEEAAPAAEAAGGD
jgi:creatine kinase